MKSKFIEICEENITHHKIDTLVKSEISKQYPIIEEIPNDNSNKLVTFIYHGDQDCPSVNIYSSLIGNYPNKMSRLTNTNYFYYTLIVPNNIRVSYGFLPNDRVNYDGANKSAQRVKIFSDMWSRLIADPFNSNKMELKNNDPQVIISISILEMQLAPSQYWSLEQLSASSGKINKLAIFSDILKEKRNYWVYLPPSYNENISYPLLIVFDGQLYYESGIPLPTILNNLINEKKIPPLIAVLIDSIGFERRVIDLKCSENFLDFIINELLPEIRSRYLISNDRLDKIVMGASLGGLFALYLSLKRSDVFGKAISNSGTDSVIRQLIKNDQMDKLTIYLDIGTLENPGSTEEIRDLLLAAGHKVIYHVFPGSHDYKCWETSIPNALMQLF